MGHPRSENAVFDTDVRHFIYTTFADSTRPPTTAETAMRFNVSIASAEDAYTRLAAAHQIALAPGSHRIWMAHPFSGIPTNYTTQVGSKRFWGN